MTDKDNLEAAFLAGFITARKAGFTGNDLHPVTERTARKKFERWHEMEMEN